MQAQAYVYHIGMHLDPKKLSKISGLKKVDGLELFEKSIGNLRIQVFLNGEIRAFVPGKTINELKEVLIVSGVKIVELLEEIKKQGYKFDVEEVFKNGHQMDFTYETPEGTRVKLKNEVAADLLKELIYSAHDIMPEFQAERNSVQAGENIGRRLVRIYKPKNTDELADAIVKYFKEQKIGIVTYKTKKDEKESNMKMYTFRVDECAVASGIPLVNKPVCHITRGLIRGAFCQFLELENVAVKETKCWGLGDTYCEFLMKVFPK
ncbi:MAG: hypothetical protein J7K68_05115 [Candidatus Diapherotrites archaeon]|nr:hypothetical protein [Candidatus Diapherotrites archaeon]